MIPAIKHFFWRANAKQLSLYFRQLHAMLHAGIGLAYALTSLGDNAPNWALRRASAEMGQRVFANQSWSESLRAYPTLFSEMVLAVIIAAESTGRLELACQTLANYAERQYEIEQTIKRDTWYPKILLFVSTVIFCLPIRVSIGETVWTLGFTEQVLLISVPWGIWKAANYFWPVGARGGAGRIWLDNKRLKIPVVGKTVRAFAVAKFCRVLGLSYAAGLSVPQGVELAGQACGNMAITAKMRDAYNSLRQGKTLTESLAATHELPAIALPMLRSGEVTGELDPQLQATARFLEADAETALKQSVTLMCVIIFLLVAVKIGVQVYQFWKDYYGL